MSHLPPPRGARAELARRAEVAEVMADTFALDLEQVTTSSLSESTSRLELALEDIGWQRLIMQMQTEFSRSGLERMATICRLMWRKNPLIRRAVNVRTYYLFAQGLTVTADDPDVNDLVQGFYDDPVNQKAVFGPEARETLDRTLATDGNLAFVLVTHQATGRVQVRTLPWTQIKDPVRNPEDRADVWYWHRRWHDTAGMQHDLLHPDVDYIPSGVRPSHVTVGNQPIEVQWDQPLLMETVDRLDGETWGVPEVYAAIDWAKAYKEFLEDWASYVRALAEFAWRHKSKTNAAAKRAKATHGISRTDSETGARKPAGATAVGTDVEGLEPIKHSGAHVDATSGRTLALMVASAMDMPYAILTGDADNSNLATAKTLDRPFELSIMQRRSRVSARYQRMFRHVLEASARAPRGDLTGQVERDEWGHTVVRLLDELDTSVRIDWPSLVEHDLKDVVESIKFATQASPELPADTVMRLLLTVFEVDDVDQVVEDAMAAAAEQDTIDAAQAAAMDQVAEAIREAFAGQDAA